MPPSSRMAARRSSIGRWQAEERNPVVDRAGRRAANDFATPPRPSGQSEPGAGLGSTPPARSLFVQDFDPTRLELRGNASPVAEWIALNAGAQGSAAVSASMAGPFVYRTGSAVGLRQFVWLDRSGKEIGKAGDQLAAFSVELSPDGHRLSSSEPTRCLGVTRSIFRSNTHAHRELDRVSLLRLPNRNRSQ
jgi:hypothetical protein